MEKKIICKSCAAEFSDMLPECPYCGTMNYKGAEAEYLGKLENVREDMEELDRIPEKEQKKELRRQASFWVKVLLVIAFAAGILFAIFCWQENKSNIDNRKEFLWISENGPKLDKLYDEEDYDALQELYFQYSEEERPLWRWQHNDFMYVYNSIVWAETALAREAQGNELSEDHYVDLFYDMWVIKGIEFRTGLDEDEVSRLKKLSEGISLDFNARWGMSDEEYAEFYKKLEENQGYIGFKDCEEYIKKWYAKE